MNAVLSEIERQKWDEWTRNEAAMCNRFAEYRPPPLTENERALLKTFTDYCAANRVRWCPATPYTVAAFVRDHSTLGERRLADILRAIAVAHDLHGKANPVVSGAVSAALLQTETPRWPDADKVLFSLLPAAVRSVILQRESERDKGLRQSQNKLAIERNRLTEERNKLQSKDHGEEKRDAGAEDNRSAVGM